MFKAQGKGRRCRRLRWKTHRGSFRPAQLSTDIVANHLFLLPEPGVWGRDSEWTNPSEWAECAEWAEAGPGAVAPEKLCRPPSLRLRTESSESARSLNSQELWRSWRSMIASPYWTCQMVMPVAYRSLNFWEEVNVFSMLMPGFLGPRFHLRLGIWVDKNFLGILCNPQIDGNTTDTFKIALTTPWLALIHCLKLYCPLWQHSNWDHSASRGKTYWCQRCFLWFSLGSLKVLNARRHSLHGVAWRCRCQRLPRPSLSGRSDHGWQDLAVGAGHLPRYGGGSGEWSGCFQSRRRAPWPTGWLLIDVYWMQCLFFNEDNVEVKFFRTLSSYVIPISRRFNL